MLLADLRKMRRPLFILLSIGVMVSSAYLTVHSQRNATDSRTATRESLAYMLKLQASGDWAKYGGRDALASAIKDQKDLIVQVDKWAELSGATQHPLGALGFALGLTCSMLGAFAILIAASLHVAGEWSGRTIKEVLVVEGRRGRLLWTKCASLFIFGIWLLFCSWLGIVLWGLVIRRWIVLDHVASAKDTFAWFSPMLWRAPLVILMFVAVAVSLSVLLRQRIRTLVVGAAVILACNAFARNAGPSVSRWSPASWVASWMGFGHRWFLDYKIWVDAPRGLSAWLGAIGVCGTIIVALALAALYMRRREAFGLRSE